MKRCVEEGFPHGKILAEGRGPWVERGSAESPEALGSHGDEDVMDPLIAGTPGSPTADAAAAAAIDALCEEYFGH